MAGSSYQTSQRGVGAARPGAHALPKPPSSSTRAAAWKHPLRVFNIQTPGTSGSPILLSAPVLYSESESEELQDEEEQQHSPSEHDSGSVSLSPLAQRGGSRPGGHHVAARLHFQLVYSATGDLPPRACGVKGTQPPQIAFSTFHCALSAGRTSSLPYLRTIASPCSRLR